jgi:hypothetical protein
VKRGERSERVRKSSGGTLGAVKLENDFAADLSAWSEAVRFDLNDLNRMDALGGVATIPGIGMSQVTSQSLGVKWSNGWSRMQSSFGGDCTSFSLRSGAGFLPIELGVDGLLHDDATDRSSVSVDGIEGSDSLETDLDAMKSLSCSLVLAILPASSPSQSSGRSSKMSSGECMFERPPSRSSCLHSSINSSIDICRSTGPLRRRFDGGGIDVTASSAATAGGIPFCL